MLLCGCYKQVVYLCKDKYDSLTNLRDINIEEAGGKQRAIAQVRYVTRTQLSNVGLSVVETGRMRQKQG